MAYHVLLDLGQPLFQIYLCHLPLDRGSLLCSVVMLALFQLLEPPESHMRQAFTRAFASV